MERLCLTASIIDLRFGSRPVVR